MAAATFIRGALNMFSSLAAPLLDAALQFILLALDELQIVIHQLRKPLFQFAFGNIPLSLGCEQIHKSSRPVVLLPPLGWPRHETLLQVTCRSIAAPIGYVNPSFFHPLRL